MITFTVNNNTALGTCTDKNKFECLWMKCSYKECGIHVTLNHSWRNTVIYLQCTVLLTLDGYWSHTNVQRNCFHCTQIECQLIQDIEMYHSSISKRGKSLLNRLQTLNKPNCGKYESIAISITVWIQKDVNGIVSLYFV